MKKFSQSMIDNFIDISMSQKPDFNNLLKVLDKKKPDRYTLFEFFMNGEFYLRMTGEKEYPKTGFEQRMLMVNAFRAAGYDYCTMHASGFGFKNNSSNHGLKSRSMNDCSVIEDRESYNHYQWNDPDDYSIDVMLEVAENLPDGMKLIVYSPGGVLENVMQIFGYNNLCYLLADDQKLVEDVFNDVGSRLLKYYQRLVNINSIGAFISNDDWGFNTQTMMSVPDMRKYVFPWHKKIVETVHSSGKPAILHSCGNLGDVYGDIIDDMKFDGKHSYEDLIQPVEEAYEMVNPKIAVLGGIDVDFVIRESPEAIYNRACAMLERTESRGGYALGTGNSVPYYVPTDNFIALLAACVFNRN